MYCHLRQFSKNLLRNKECVCSVCGCVCVSVFVPVCVSVCVRVCVCVSAMDELKGYCPSLVKLLDDFLHLIILFLELVVLAFELLILAFELLVFSLQFLGVCCHHRSCFFSTLDHAVLPMIASGVVRFNRLIPVLTTLAFFAMIAVAFVGLAVEWFQSVSRELGDFFGGVWIESASLCKIDCLSDRRQVQTGFFFRIGGAIGSALITFARGISG